MRNSPIQGEQVLLKFSGTLASHNTSTSANAGQLIIYDLNNSIRVLKAYERLVIDNIQIDMTGDTNGNEIYLISAPKITAGGPPLAQIQAEFPAATSNGPPPSGNQTQDYTRQGRNMPLGVTPYLFTNGVTQSIILTGDARIVATTPPGRMPWRELLTANGNF